VFSSATFVAMTHHLVARHLQADNTSAHLVRETYIRGIALMVLFAASVPLFFVTKYGWVLWLVAPPLTGQLVRRWPTR
jgi:hypothetical protein